MEFCRSSNKLFYRTLLINNLFGEPGKRERISARINRNIKYDINNLESVSFRTNVA